MNKFKFISIAFFLVALILFAIPNYSKADGLTPSEIIDSGKSFLNDADDKELFNEQNEKAAVDQIYYIALTIGICVAVIVGVVLGIQYITSGVVGQAKVKEKLIPFAIGAFVVFGAFGIWRIALNMTTSVFGD